MNRTFVGFGFGAIQSGLLLYEAYKSENFSRLVVAEVIPAVVAAVREVGDILRGLWKDAPESEAHAIIARIEEGYRDLDHEGASGRNACRLADLQP